MRRWELAVALDPARELPLFLQLARGIAHDIRNERLRPGEALPGSRELANCLGVNRNTVVASYGELVAEGLVHTRIGGGTFVAAPAPTLPSRHRLSSHDEISTPTYSLAPSLHPRAPSNSVRPGALMLAGGLPDVRLFPARELARALRKAIERRGRALLTYADACGHIRLRNELAAMLGRTRALAVTAQNIMVTRSIEQAIDLVARTLLAPGDTVAVEAFGYPPAWSVLRLAGARLVPIAVDEEGLDVDALEARLAREPIRAVFTTPHHQYPTTAVMSHQRRAKLADLALRHRFAIIEDDYDHEFHYEGKPVLPIAAGAGRSNVVYIGSLANLLAPGVSTAFVIAPPAVFEHLAGLRAASDARGDAAMECAIAELFEDGELLRHMRRVRRVYASRRDVLATALDRHLGGAIRFRLPEGGMALWGQVDEDIDTAAWARAGEDEGVLFHDSRAMDFEHRNASFLRLGFSFHDEAELDEAVRPMARALVREPSTRRARAPAPPPAACNPRRALVS